jgi:hypothetical protein
MAPVPEVSRVRPLGLPPRWRISHLPNHIVNVGEFLPVSNLRTSLLTLAAQIIRTKAGWAHRAGTSFLAEGGVNRVLYYIRFTLIEGLPVERLCVLRAAREYSHALSPCQEGS